MSSPELSPSGSELLPRAAYERDRAPLALTLPSELLSLIFTLAQPQLPELTTDDRPLGNAWTGFVALSLVHSAWTAGEPSHLS